MKRKFIESNAGMTLIEVILSMTILSLISVPLLNYFADSMHYSTLMATKQRATLLGQNVVEYMKGQDEVMQPIEDSDRSKNGGLVSAELQDRSNHFYNPCLTETSEYGFSLLSNNIKEDGTGSAVYYKTADANSSLNPNLDVCVTVSADSNNPYNSEAQPVIYGLSSATDILAVERNQKMEAALNFFSKVPGVTYSKITDVYNDMTMDMYIKFSASDKTYTDEDGDVKNMIHCSVYYVYKCHDLTYQSVALLDEDRSTLNSVYLLYDSLDYDSANAYDTLHVVKDSSFDSLKLTNFNPKIFVVCQNCSKEGNTSYKIRADIFSGVEIHTNICANPSNGSNLGSVCDMTGKQITTYLITGNSNVIREITIEVSVYNKGKGPKVGTAASEEPLITYTVTKGE